MVLGATGMNGLKRSYDLGSDTQTSLPRTYVIRIFVLIINNFYHGVNDSKMKIDTSLNLFPHRLTLVLLVAN